MPTSYFGSNKLSSLPESITKLINLQTLDLGDNQLSSLPESITKLTNLQTLYLEGNKLSSLPESITKLINLQTLDLADNQLSSLPDSITKLTNLRRLYLRGNPLVSPPEEVASKGVTAIYEYFRQIEEEGSGYLYEAKLLILGEGGAGKTTLAKKIENPSYKLEEERSTEGIDVIEWEFPVKGDRKFRVNIWDFGGQEIYHSTHQFFLTRRSLYILVADTRKEDTDFFYWLNVVDLLSENSPLLIVKNEKQDRHREINERQLRGQFENLKKTLITNLATNRGLLELIEDIKHYIQSLPHIGTHLPATWVRVREDLERDDRNYISLDEYLKICKKNGFKQEKDSLQLSSYLNDIGIFLHFQDEDLLRKTVILKPKWGTDAVYKVLDNIDVIRNLGKFSRADLGNIWYEAEYKDMHIELLHLMMKFKLCYEIPNQPNFYIAPQLLTENQPEYTWDEKGNLLLRYSYEFMPKGILMQFIVAMNENIWKQKYVWKSGVILKKGKSFAEVIEYYGLREMRIRVAGTHCRELMTIVIHELDKIHKSYKRLKYNKLIPCNCETCKQKAEPHFYRYEQLYDFIGKEIPKIQCGQTGKMISVRGLIDDFAETFLKKDDDKRKNQGVHHHYYHVAGDLIQKGEKTVSKQTIKLENSSIGGSVVSANNIQNSLNIIQAAPIKEELKEKLQLLTALISLFEKVRFCFCLRFP